MSAVQFAAHILFHFFVLETYTCKNKLLETFSSCTFQKDADPSKRNDVVLLLQDMLEVVTRDMMVNEIRLV